MSPRKMEELIDDLEAEGAEALAGEFRAAWDASPVRKDRDEAVKRAEAALAEAKRYQQVVIGQRLKELGVKVNPSALRTPDDLDWADDAKVKEWATTAGVYEPPATDTSSPEVDAHARITDAAQGAPAPRHDPRADLLAKTDPALGVTEEQFYAELRAAGFTNDAPVDATNQ